MLSRRRLIYYTIVLTSFFWIFGTLTFFVLQSLEVNIEVKRRSVEYFPLQKPRWNFKVDNFVAFPLRSPPSVDDGVAQDNNTLIIEKKATFRKQKKAVLVSANYESDPREARDLNGPGELGEAVTVDPELKEEEEKGYELHAFNLAASNIISLHRSLKDHRVDA